MKNKSVGGAVGGTSSNSTNNPTSTGSASVTTITASTFSISVATLTTTSSSSTTSPRWSSSIVEHLFECGKAKRTGIFNTYVN